MNLTNRQQLLAIVAVAVVAIFASDRLVFGPLLKSWEARSARLVELRKSVDKGRTLLERDKNIRAHWDNMRTNTLSSEVSVAEGQVLNRFDRWAQESRVAISAIRPQWKRNAEDYLTLECRVDAAGNLPALAKFLYSVEKDPMALKVESLELTARDDNANQLSLGLQVSGLLLNFKPKR